MTATLASAHSWFNGMIGPREVGAPSIASANFHLGTSVFDGMMAYWNHDHYYLHKGPEHIRRFQHGCARMGLNFEWSCDELLVGIHQLLNCEPVGTQYVRPIAYRRSPELWVTGNKNRRVDVSIFTVRVPGNDDSGISCHISPIERISNKSIPGQTKVSGAYVNSYHARHTAEEAGFQDAIMLDRTGFVAEASAANLFCIKGGRLFTPQLSGDIFPGITRLTILEIAYEMRLNVQEIEMLPAFLLDCDGAFLCSTLMEIKGLNSIGPRKLNTQDLPIYNEIRDAFQRITGQ
jgi:branched-chain amino acid aminotransferase